MITKYLQERCGYNYPNIWWSGVFPSKKNNIKTYWHEFVLFKQDTNVYQLSLRSYASSITFFPRQLSVSSLVVYLINLTQFKILFSIAFFDLLTSILCFLLATFKIELLGDDLRLGAVLFFYSSVCHPVMHSRVQPVSFIFCLNQFILS